MNVAEGACRDFGRALQLEWLEANGIGGYAAGTVAGPNTRRYHGLLVAATAPPRGRRVLLNKLDDVVLGPGGMYPLCANIYEGALHPQGYRYLVACRLEPFPAFVYELPVGVIEKQICMPHGRNAVIITYHLVSAPAALRLQVRPLLSCRDHHHLVRATDAADPRTHGGDHAVWWAPWGEGSEIGLSYPGSYTHDPCWYYSFIYPVERERRLDHVEDLLSPGSIEFELQPGAYARVVAFAGRDMDLDAEAAIAAEEQRRGALPCLPGVEADSPLQALCASADQFVVRGADGLLSVIAGYPWFADWGRDTLIALPGLALALGRDEQAAELLTAFVRHMDRGLVPNRFPETGATAEYNTVDATLWLFAAAEQYAAATGDMTTVAQEFYPALTEAIQWHLRGTRHGIHAAEDGLLCAGEPGDQLTWMDAKVGDWVVTPRHGKPIEVQGLWVRALRGMAGFARRLGQGEQAAQYAHMADQARQAVAAQFWDEEFGYLCDCVQGEGCDTALRPNQIIALAAAPDLVARPRLQRCLEATTAELLTPYGLRTLSPRHPDYRGTYGGDQLSRDGAYHQGTVWPWLLGPYLDVFFAANGVSDETRNHATGLLQPLLRHVGQAGLGSISELFDGDEPHRPGGCFAQAWSVGELLRVTQRYGLCGVPLPPAKRRW